MPGDGVSLPTTLAQMGNVAKAQARGQQAAPQVTPFSEQKDDKNDLKVQRVKETAPAEKSRVDADREEKDKRKRRRLKRRRNRYPEFREGHEPDGNEDFDPECDLAEDGTEEEELLGGLLDLRV